MTKCVSKCDPHVGQEVESRVRKLTLKSMFRNANDCQFVEVAPVAINL